MKILVLFNSMSPLFHAILSFTEIVMESLHDLSPRSLLTTESPQLSLVKQPGLNTSHGAFPVLASVQYGFFSDQGVLKILYSSRNLWCLEVVLFLIPKNLSEVDEFR